MAKKRKETHAPEIIYTSEDLYNHNIATYQLKPYQSYTQEQRDYITNEVLRLISTGQSTSKAVTNAQIDISTWHKWCDNDPFTYSRYIRACERLGLSLFDRILDEVDSMTTVEESIIASKKIDALKWLSGKLNQRFSDRSDVYIQNVNNTLNANTSELSQVERDKIMKTILGKLNSKIEALPGPNNVE